MHDLVACLNCHTRLATRRGLCGSCYTKLGNSVRAGKATWQQLEREGRCKAAVETPRRPRGG
jgi:hypothetical protein